MSHWGYLVTAARVRACATWLVLMAAAAACGSRTALNLGDDTTNGNGGADGDASTDGGDDDGGPISCSEPGRLCAGKCGVLPRVCDGGKVDCGGCPAGESCGAGGTPNVCAKCTPNCTGKACGDADGCGSRCNVQTCDRSKSCVEGECVCSAAATAVAAGGGHTCVLTRGGGLQCWGENYSGQIGNGNSEDSNVPAKVLNLAGVTAAAAGASHTCAIVTGGDLFCWGDNNSGQLGNGKFGGVTKVPRPVPGIGGVKAVVAGAAHTCALTSAGAVYCWGGNAEGQLGIGAASGAFVPTLVVGLGSGVTAIATAYSHTCAVREQGDVVCWGLNTLGQLGDGTADNSPVPVGVVGLTGSAVTVATGFSSTCAAMSAGTTMCWGNNTSGQLGNDSEKSSLNPVLVEGPPMNATSLTLGVLFACALGNGGVSCWGDNVSGQLADGTNIRRHVPNPTLPPDAKTISISSGDEHACAVSKDGCVVCWGDNLFGQLGNGANVDSFLPVVPVGY